MGMGNCKIKSTVVFLIALTFGITISFVLFNQQNPSSIKPDPMAQSFVLWLHGLGDSGPANEPIKTLFTSPQFSKTKWSFPSAPSNPVTCNYGAVMPSWFDIAEIPVKADSPKDEGSVLKAVQNIHAMIDKEIAAGINPNNVFVCGFSQGGALTLASVLLYPKSLGGGAVFSGWVPFNSSILERATPEAKKTPILWSHGMADRTVLFEAGEAGPPVLEKAGVSCEFKWKQEQAGQSWRLQDFVLTAYGLVLKSQAYPGLGHSISNEELRSLESWLKSHLQSSS